MLTRSLSQDPRMHRCCFYARERLSIARTSWGRMRKCPRPWFFAL